jgi:hypothetical protein
VVGRVAAGDHPPFRIARIETPHMTPQQYDNAVEALAVLITAHWDKCGVETYENPDPRPPELATPTTVITCLPTVIVEPIWHGAFDEITKHGFALSGFSPG